MLNDVALENLLTKIIAFQKKNDLRNELIHINSFIKNDQEKSINFLYQLFNKKITNAFIIFFEISINSAKDQDEYIEKFASIFSNKNQESSLYEAIKICLTILPENIKLLKKASYLSLYLGNLDDCYHWSCCLEIFHSAALHQARKRRTELYLGKVKPLVDHQAIAGNYFSRSTNCNFKEGDPPGESSILKINPNRKKLIQNLTDWNEVYAGTFNIRTKISPQSIKNNIIPCAYEPGINVNYPNKHELIPKKRIGYWYYHGYIYNKNKIFPVLFRYPEYPAFEDVLEVFSEKNLRENLEINENSIIICYFCQSLEEKSSWLDCKMQIYESFFKEKQDFGRDQILYQGHENWMLPGQRPSIYRIKNYSLESFISSKDDILDIGCNIGCLGIECSKMAASYTGFDNNGNLIDIAKNLASYYSIKNCFFEKTDFNKFLKSNQRKYNIIFSFAVHVWIDINMEDYSKKLISLLKPNGIILIESNNLNTNDKEFIKNMRFFINQGLKIINKGMIKDDQLIERSFFVFQS